jgi:transcriptional regulator with XRE-family HTH domain
VLKPDLAAVMTQVVDSGSLLREWRLRRRLSQTDLAIRAELPVKRVSAIETGRESAGRDMLLHLAGCLDLGFRERNALLVADGHSAAHPAHDLKDPALAWIREGLLATLHAHEPLPAMAFDRHWRLRESNPGFHRLIAGVDPTLLHPPINIIRLFLHPVGLAPRIINLRQWREHLIGRLRQQFEREAETEQADLLEEVLDYPLPQPAPTPPEPEPPSVLALRLVTIDGTLELYTTVTRFAAPVAVSLSELTVESFYPLNAKTRVLLDRMAALKGPRTVAELRAAAPAWP